MPAQNVLLETARAQEFAAIQNKIAQDQMLNDARQFVARQQENAALKAALENYQQQQLSQHVGSYGQFVGSQNVGSYAQNVGAQSQNVGSYSQNVGSQSQFVGSQMVGATSQTGTSTTTQIRPLGCTPTKVPVYTEKDQPGANEYAFCGEQNLRGSQTLKRTNLHHNYVHDVNHLHNYHNRIKHQARQFNTVVKDCSCVGETEQLQGCPCEADP